MSALTRGLGGKTPAEAWAATPPAPEPAAEPRMPSIPPSAHTSTSTSPPGSGTSATSAAQTRSSRAPLALHAPEGTLTVRIKKNGQVKALGCLFYVSTSRAGQLVHVLWNEQRVEIFTHDGESLMDYPRPSTTGLYYGPRAARHGTPMKTAGQNPSAGISGTAQRTVSKGGYVGVLASKFYAGYKRRSEQVTITWDATTVTITDTSGTTIATYAKPTQRGSSEFGVMFGR
jgi:putative transposase